MSNLIGHSTGLFDNVISQYIDANGKLRALIYDLYDGVTLMTSPLPPLDKPVHSLANIPIIDSDYLEEFVNQKGLTITFQDGDEHTLRGVWVEQMTENPIIEFGYIPVANGLPFLEVQFANNSMFDPLRTRSSSQLQTMRELRKLGKILKMYVLYAYSLNPDNFGEDSFDIIEGYEYSIEFLKNRLSLNDIMFSHIDENPLLIVPSQAVRDKLLNYLHTQLSNDPTGVLLTKNKKTTDVYYQNISDFEQKENTLIFFDRASIHRWKQEALRVNHNNTIFDKHLPNIHDPYFFKSSVIGDGNTVYIVQNVDGGNLQRALFVANRWKDHRVNNGYDSDKIDGEVEYNVYNKEKLIKKVGESPRLSLLQYDDKSYAALLPLEN